MYMHKPWPDVEVWCQGQEQDGGRQAEHCGAAQERGWEEPCGQGYARQPADAHAARVERVR